MPSDVGTGTPFDFPMLSTENRVGFSRLVARPTLFPGSRSIPSNSGSIRHLINRRRPDWVTGVFQHGFDCLYRGKREQRIAAHGTNLGENILDYDHIPVMLDDMGDALFFALAGTGVDGALIHDLIPPVEKAYRASWSLENDLCSVKDYLLEKKPGTILQTIQNKMCCPQLTSISKNIHQPINFSSSPPPFFPTIIMEIKTP